MHVTRE